MLQTCSAVPRNSGLAQVMLWMGKLRDAAVLSVHLLMFLMISQNDRRSHLFIILSHRLCQESVEPTQRPKKVALVLGNNRHILMPNAVASTCFQEAGSMLGGPSMHRHDV